MKVSTTLIFLFLLISGKSFAEPEPRLQQPFSKALPNQRNPQKRSNRIPRNSAAPIQEVIQGFYENRIKEGLALDEHQLAEISPVIRKSLRKRNQLGRQRSRALNVTRRALTNGAPEEEILEHIKTLDAVENALQNEKDNFIDKIDLHLTTSQRARLRIIQPNIEQRIRTLIQRSRNRGNQRRKPPN